MEVNKEELERRIAECTVFSQCSISFGTLSSTCYLYSSFHIFELCWNVLNKIGELDSGSATLPKKVCTEEVFL